MSDKLDGSILAYYKEPDNDIHVAIKCFYDYEGELPNKLIALYSDGSGCEMYFRKGEWHYPASATPEDIERYDGVDKDWFEDSGYLWFIALPDDFKVWGEEDAAS